MRQGLSALINQQPDLEVCCEAESAGEAMTAAERKPPPDLVLADISLPGKNGIELIKDLLAPYPDLRILVLSMHDEALYAERVLRAGGRGYIMKQEGGKKLIEAIRKVLAGEIYVSEKMASQILEMFSGQHRNHEGSLIQQLTDREFDVFHLIGQGKTTREIGTTLHISVKTVEVHRANIKRKLDIATAPELIRYAVRWVESQNLPK